MQKGSVRQKTERILHLGDWTVGRGVSREISVRGRQRSTTSQFGQQGEQKRKVEALVKEVCGAGRETVLADRVEGVVRDDDGERMMPIALEGL